MLPDSFSRHPELIPFLRTVRDSIWSNAPVLVLADKLDDLGKHRCAKVLRQVPHESCGFKCLGKVSHTNILMEVRKRGCPQCKEFMRFYHVWMPRRVMFFRRLRQYTRRWPKFGGLDDT